MVTCSHLRLLAHTTHTSDQSRTYSAPMVPSAILLVLLPLFGFQMMLHAKPTARCRTLPIVVVKDAQKMLQELKPFPENCRVYKMNISLPDSILPTAAASHSQCRRAMWVTYKVSEELLHMIIQHGFPVGKNGVKWDERKLKDFLSCLDRLEEDGNCLPLDVEASGLLSSFFSNATSVIEEQDSAVCGWLNLMDDVLWFLTSTLQTHIRCFNQSHAH